MNKWNRMGNHFRMRRCGIKRGRAGLILCSKQELMVIGFMQVIKGG